MGQFTPFRLELPGQALLVFLVKQSTFAVQLVQHGGSTVNLNINLLTLASRRSDRYILVVFFLSHFSFEEAASFTENTADEFRAAFSVFEAP